MGVYRDAWAEALSPQLSRSGPAQLFGCHWPTSCPLLKVPRPPCRPGQDRLFCSKGEGFPHRLCTHNDAKQHACWGPVCCPLPCQLWPPGPGLHEPGSPRASWLPLPGTGAPACALGSTFAAVLQHIQAMCLRRAECVLKLVTFLHCWFPFCYHWDNRGQALTVQTDFYGCQQHSCAISMCGYVRIAVNPL